MSFIGLEDSNSEKLEDRVWNVHYRWHVTIASVLEQSISGETRSQEEVWGVQGIDLMHKTYLCIVQFFLLKVFSTALPGLESASKTVYLPFGDT